MGFCPNCGSYVSPAANVCSCGTTFGYGSEPKKEKETEFQKHERKKFNNNRAFNMVICCSLMKKDL